MINIIFNFLIMGGHGFYIWTAYFIPLTLIFAFVIVQRFKLKSIQKHETKI